MILLLLTNSIQLAYMGSIVSSVDHYNKGVVDEIGKIRQDVVMFGNDLNEMRNFLLLPTKDYSSMSEVASIDQDSQDEQKSSVAEAALYQFLAQTTEEESAQRNTADAEKTYRSLIEDKEGEESLHRDLSTKGFIIEAEKPTADNFSFSISSKSDEEKAVSRLFSVVIEKKTNKAFFTSYLGSQELHGINPLGYSSEILKLTLENAPKVQALLAKILQQEKAVTSFFTSEGRGMDVLKKRKIGFESVPGDQENVVSYHFTNEAHETVASFSVRKKDGTFVFENKSYVSMEELMPPLMAFLQKVDVSTAEQKQLKSRKQELEAIFKQKAFADLLKTNGLTIQFPPREEPNKVLYDVLKPDKTVAFSFVIEISSGMYKVLKDGNEIDLYSFLDPEGSKKKP